MHFTLGKISVQTIRVPIQFSISDIKKELDIYQNLELMAVACIGSRPGREILLPQLFAVQVLTEALAVRLLSKREKNRQGFELSPSAILLDAGHRLPKLFLVLTHVTAVELLFTLAPQVFEYTIQKVGRRLPTFGNLGVCSSVFNQSTHHFLPVAGPVW